MLHSQKAPIGKYALNFPLTPTNQDNTKSVGTQARDSKITFVQNVCGSIDKILLDRYLPIVISCTAFRSLD